MNVVWTEGAAQDLTEIVDFIADDSPEAARRVAKQIFDSLTRLGSTPRVGGNAWWGWCIRLGSFARSTFADAYTISTALRSSKGLAARVSHNPRRGDP